MASAQELLSVGRQTASVCLNSSLIHSTGRGSLPLGPGLGCFAVGARANMRLLRELGDPFDRRRVIVCCQILLVVEISAFLFVVAGTHGLIVPLSGHASTDFVSFYAAGQLA